MSRLVFRGPARPLTGKYIAFVGGTETFGRFVENPFADRVEERLGQLCVNLGCVNASIDAFIHEPAVTTICHDAALNVVQIMGAQNMSNRFYTVHPRRNDRFLTASSMLRAIFPDVDFSDFCFTRHMLLALHDASAERFSIVVAELRKAWTVRMKLFLRETGPRTLLLWCAADLPTTSDMEVSDTMQQNGPLFITHAMLDEMRPLVRGLIIVPVSALVQAQGTQGMIFSPGEQEAASTLPSPSGHAEIADYLTDAVRLALATPVLA